MDFRNTRAKKREEPRLEITPLIDVVFLLLLFFLITSNFVRENNTQLPLDLPSAGSGEASSESKRVTVFVGPDGTLQINDGFIRPGEVINRLETLYKEDPDIQLLIKGDKGANYGRITDIIDNAKKVGFERVNLVVKPRK